MKKSLSILLCLASILISVLYCMNAQYKDQIRIQNLQHSSSSWQLNIPVPDGQIPAFIDFLERVSSAYDTDIVLTTFVNDPGSSRLTEYRAGIYRDSAMGLDSEDLLFGTFPQQENQFLATWPTGQQNQSGLLYDLFQDQPLIVNSLRDYVAQGHDSLSGTYTFFSPPEQREAIVEKISEFLHLDPSRLFETPWQRQYIQGPVAVFFLLLGICLLLYLLFCLYYPYSRLKEIGRLKLLGFSSLGIWKKLMRFVFLPPAVLDVFILISLWMLYPETKISFFGGLFLAQSAVLAVSALLSWFMLLIIRNWKISELIRGRVHSKLPFYAAFLLKAVSFLALSVCLLPAFQGAQLLVNTMQMKQELEKQQGILTLASYRYTGHEFQDTLNGIKTLETKLYSLFRLLEEECQAGFVSSYLVGYETILFSRDLWDDLPDFHPLPEKMYPVMTVNENYGDHLIQSLKIPDYEPRQAITLLVSDSWMDNGNPSSALRFLERYVQRNEDPDSTQRPDYAVYTYPAGQTVFSDSVDLAEQGYTWLKDPVVVILPPSALERKKSWLLDSASSNPIRLEDTPQNMAFLKKAVQNLDLEENHLVFSSLLHSGYIQSIQGYQRVLILWTGVLFFFILVSIVSSWLLVMMILKIQKQRMTVSHLLGISFFHRYRWEWTGTAVIYLSGLLILLTEKAAPEVLMVYGILAGSDLAITAFLLIRQDRESISESLKGRN